MSTKTAPLLRIVASRGGQVGKDRTRYFLYLNGRWRWRPTKAMKAYGFGLVTMGPGGPGNDANGHPRASVEDQQRAIELNRAWDMVRSGHAAAPARTTLKHYPDGSVGDGYQRAMALRKAGRVAKGVIWTKEQEKRDGWPRAWKWLEPKFADCDPRTIEPEHFLRLDPDGTAKGLVPEIEAAVSITERHMVIKVWRALWKKMAAMKYCSLDADPAKSFANTPPEPRDEVWRRRETLKLVQVAWRHEFYGLAALMAVAWDSQLSPIDNRALTPGQARVDDVGIYFALARTKTGRAAAATLTPWSQAILLAYLRKLGLQLLDTTPLFWTRGGRPVSRAGTTGQWGGDHGGGRHIQARPYTKSSLNQDFRKVRKLAFGELEARQLQDMRRSGGVEGDAGGGSVEDQSNKMANTVDRNKQLRKAYNPVNIASVRRFDEARAIGARKLEQAEQRTSGNVTLDSLATLLKSRG
ncbi:hypothetical protein [Bradyrhizobium sp. JYMT SZCCT0428]|uniref:hypothetical protein n=1 Tax=Bradyrhizobium sp. JYMT SZCCT0428 TaxID=2807673 RepID=UPI001BA927C1|nr:hypothetical protein [Bradyrhizobium sp. JYMT SZCCT0428]MBR1150138.1 hypothetical protein [Bradyrhizobium sp. JYMT SZCCT0428]